MKTKNIITAALLMLMAGGVNAKDLPLKGKRVITHDYNCVGVATGDKVSMTVWEMAGAASMILTGGGISKPTTVTLMSQDDQDGATRIYKMESPDNGGMVMEIADTTQMTILTTLPFAGKEAYTSKVCYADN